jgi:acetyl esterase
MAPEHKFPAAVDDCYSATRWVANHTPDIGADPKCIAVDGDSAGGGLATAVTLMARDQGSPQLKKGE